MSNVAKWGKRPTAKDPVQASTPIDQFVNGGPVKREVVKDVRLNVLIPPDLHKRVKSGCVDEGVTMTEVVIQYLEERFPSKK